MSHDDYYERERQRREDQRRADQRREDQRHEDKYYQHRRQDEDYERRKQAEQNEKLWSGARTGDYEEWLREMGYVSPYSRRRGAAGTPDAPVEPQPHGAAPPTREEFRRQTFDSYRRALGEANEYKASLLNWIDYSDAFRPYSRSEMWLIGYRRDLRDWVAGIDPAWEGAAGLLGDYLNRNTWLASYGLLYDWLRRFRDVCDAVRFWGEMLR